MPWLDIAENVDSLKFATFEANSGDRIRPWKDRWID